MVSWSCRIRLTGITRALRGKPRNNIGDLLIRHRLRSMRSPIRHALIRPPGDHDAAQSLIADQRKIRPIHDGANLTLAALCIAGGPFTRSSMASRTVDAESLLSTRRITGQRGLVRRKTRP